MSIIIYQAQLSTRQPQLLLKYTSLLVRAVEGRLFFLALNDQIEGRASCRGRSSRSCAAQRAMTLSRKFANLGAPSAPGYSDLCSQSPFLEPEVRMEVPPAAGTRKACIPPATLSIWTAGYWGHDGKRPSIHPKRDCLE